MPHSYVGTYGIGTWLLGCVERGSSQTIDDSAQGKAQNVALAHPLFAEPSMRTRSSSTSCVARRERARRVCSRSTDLLSSLPREVIAEICQHVGASEPTELDAGSVFSFDERKLDGMITGKSESHSVNPYQARASLVYPLTHRMFRLQISRCLHPS